MSGLLPPSPVLTSLLLAAQSEPEGDDTSRLVLADYLDEQGDPRGAMIRCSLALARLLPGDPGWYELSDDLEQWRTRHQAGWLGKSRAGVVEVKRGLLSLSAHLRSLARKGLPHKVNSALEQGWVGEVFYHDDTSSELLAEALASRRLERVSVLSVMYPVLSPAVWAALAALPALRGLRLRYPRQFAEADLAAVTGLPLYELELNHDDLTGRCLEHVQHFRQLRTLNLFFRADFNEDALALLSGLSELRSLFLLPGRLTRAGFAHLTRLRCLERLTLITTPDSPDDHLAGLATFPRLRELSLFLTSDDSFRSLAGLPGLERLAVADGQFHGLGLRHLAALPKLRALDLQFCRRVTDEGLTSLAELPTLEHLSLRQTVVSDAGLAPLARLTRLRSLDLSGNHRLNGTGLAYLKDLPNLRRLNLFDCCGLNKKDLPYLERLTQLRELNVSCCMIRRTTIERLRQALPQCRFVES